MAATNDSPKAGIDTVAGRIPFDREDEETLRSVAVWAIAVGVIALASAVIGAGINFVEQGIMGVISSAPTIAVNVLLTVFLLGAASSLRKVASTDAADKLYFVDGLRKLRNYFMTTGIILIIVLGLAALVLLGALTCGMLR